MLGWGISTYDALYGMQAWGHTRTSGADGNFFFGKVSDAKLDALIRAALLRLRDEHLFIPLHHQVRPWAMKPGVETLHRSNDQFEGRFTSIK